MTKAELLAELFRRFEAEVTAYQALRKEELFLRGRVRASKVMMTDALRRELQRVADPSPVPEPFE